MGGVPGRVCGRSAGRGRRPGGRLWHRRPLLDAELLDRDGWPKRPGVVEQQVDAPERLLSSLEQPTDRRGIDNVGRHDQRMAIRGRAKLGNLLEEALAAPGEDHMEARLEQAESGSPPDPCSSPGDDRDPVGY